jgi:uncharacterized membrane protein YraQ (UPF0718 family)
MGQAAPPDKRKVDWTLLILLLAIAGLAGLAWRQEGPAGLAAGLKQGGRSLVEVLPLLFFAFLLAGLAQALVSERTIRRWLGRESGWRGVLLGCLAGSLTPGGPYVYYPLAGALLQSGAGVGVLIAFVSAKNLWSLSRLPLEFALLGPQITLVRYGLTLLIPPLLGLAAQRWLGHRLRAIREGVA